MVLAHAATCAACSTELAALEAFSSNPPDPFGGASRPRPGRPGRSSRAGPTRRPARVPVPALAIAAALVLLAGAALLVRRGAADVERGSVATGLLAPAGVLDAPPEEFRFPGTGASSVRVSVFDADRSYAWTSPASASGSGPWRFRPRSGRSSGRASSTRGSSSATAARCPRGRSRSARKLRRAERSGLRERQPGGRRCRRRGWTGEATMTRSDSRELKSGPLVASDSVRNHLTATRAGRL